MDPNGVITPHSAFESAPSAFVPPPVDIGEEDSLFDVSESKIDSKLASPIDFIGEEVSLTPFKDIHARAAVSVQSASDDERKSIGDEMFKLKEACKNELNIELRIVSNGLLNIICAIICATSTPPRNALRHAVL